MPHLSQFCFKWPLPCDPEIVSQKLIIILSKEHCLFHLSSFQTTWHEITFSLNILRKKTGFMCNISQKCKWYGLPQLNLNVTKHFVRQHHFLILNWFPARCFWRSVQFPQIKKSMKLQEIEFNYTSVSSAILASFCLFKVNNGNIRTM